MISTTKEREKTRNLSAFFVSFRVLSQFRFLLIAVFVTASLDAQDLRKKAEENPLDYAFYLVKTDPDHREAEKLATIFFETGRFDDALQTIDLERDYSQKIWLVHHLSQLVKQGKKDKANQFLDKIFQLAVEGKIDLGGLGIKYIAPSFIKLERTDEALSLIDLTADNHFQTRIELVRALLENNQPELGLKLLPTEFADAEPDQKAEIIELYARLKQTEKAEKFLREFEPAAFLDESSNLRLTLFSLFNTNLALGRFGRAIELWQQHGESDDYFLTIRIIKSLLEFGHRERADFYLTLLESDRETLRKTGLEIIAVRLRTNGADFALNLAKTISDNNDSYEQQASLMLIVDHLIENSQNEEALKVLDIAFQRARKIVFEHEDLQSNGASSGTRKVRFLHNIYTRLMKLKQYPRAFAAINSIGSDHWIAKEFLMESLFDFAKQQTKILPRKEL